MRSLLESVRILQKPFEKMDWIQRGVFPVLLKVMQRNHIETLFNEVPIKVCSLSLSLSLSLSVSVSLSLLRKLVAQTHQSLLLLSGTHNRLLGICVVITPRAVESFVLCVWK
jgi:hypothetical protein